MRNFATLSLFAALAFVPSLASATTVFTDGFAAGAPGLGVTTAGNFTTINNTNVDLLGPGPANNYGNLCAAGVSQCVDLGGTPTGNNGSGFGQLQSTLIGAGTYQLTFNITGSGRGTEAITLVTFGDYSHLFDLQSADSMTISTTVNVSTPGYLLFKDTQTGNENAGTILNSASVSTAAAVTPEPSSLVLLGSGLISSAGMLMRRRKQNA